MATTKTVNSENPLEHWNEIQDLQDKVVLDLGCGWLFQEFQSTTAYFLSRGAKLVIGVDATCGEIEVLKETYPDHQFFCKVIKEVGDILYYLEEFKPEVIKMDIEGYESLMDQITPEQFASVGEIAVEYHNPACKEIVMRKLSDFGFEIFAINSFGWFCTDIDQMGILHAKRISA